eukprot:1848876-Alexandrium_andersonii.AAC.1
MPEEYARHLEQQRRDARAMEALNQANRPKRGVRKGKEYEGEAAGGLRHTSGVLKDARADP